MQKKEYTTTKKQYVMPTHKDLLDGKKYKLPILRFSPYAVYVKKVSSKQKDMIMHKDQIKVEQENLKKLSQEFERYDFLVDFQLKNGLALTDSDLDFIEKIQSISELKHMCMLERSPKQSAQILEQQIKEWKNRNPGKEIIVVSEIYTSDMLNKIITAKKLGINKYAIKFRSFKKYEVELSKFLQTLKSLDMFSIVFGIMPRRWKPSNATMLLPSLHYQADAVSRWIAWSGRKTPLTLLCEDWTYKDVPQASQGPIDYNGKNRLQIVTKNTSLNIVFDRIDTLNQVNFMIQNLKPLSKIQFKTLFN